MKEIKKTRREALGIIGKTGLFLGTGSIFFASLNINPLSATGSESEAIENTGESLPIDPEKAVISGSGSQLSVKVSGKPGRHFFVAVAGTDITQNYKMLPNSSGIINRRGIGLVSVNTSGIVNTKVYLRIITSENELFDLGLSRTEPFVVTLKGGMITGFEGVLDRQLTRIEPGLIYCMTMTEQSTIQLR